MVTSKLLKAAILLLWSISASIVSAQSIVKIEGYVSSEDGVPLEGASIMVDGSGVGAATDATGYYAIENLFAGTYNLRASFIGYESADRREIAVHKDAATRLDFRLRPVVLMFDDVLVEAERQTAGRTDFLEVLTSTDIQNSSARTLGELLIQVPGVDVIEEGGGSNEKRISIRGSNSNQVLVVVDGVPINDPFSGDVDLNQIPLATVDEVRIHKGGNSGYFGNGAMGGVLEIKSKTLTPDEIQLGTQFGDFGAFGIRPSVSGNLKSLNYFFHGEFLTEEGDYPYAYKRLDGTTIKESRINAGFTSRNYFSKLLFGFGPHAVRIQASLYDTDRGLPGLVFAWSPFAKAFGRRRILIGHYLFHAHNFGAEAHISQHLNKTEFLNDPPPDAPLRFRTVSPYHTKYRVLTNRATANVTYEVPQGHRFEVAGSWQRDDFVDKDLLQDAAGPVNETKNTSAAMVIRGEWSLPTLSYFTRAFLNSSLRLDHIGFSNPQAKRKDFEISPRLGFILAKRSEWMVGFKANWGRSFRAPTFADLFFQDLRVRGNEDLLPERSTDLDAGVQMGIPFLGRLNFNTTYFRHAIDNLIVWQLGSFATWQPFNTDALLQGWEFGATWNLWRDLLQIAASHVNLEALDKSGQRTTDKRRLIYRPERTTKIDIRLVFDNITFHYHRRMVGKRYETPANTVALSPYAVDDMTLTFRPRVKDLNIHLKISGFNLFDQRYEIVERAPLPGRNWRAGVEIAY
ncbi:TonB-dependent receptor [bacterium]|nr:TonB-dependent receptor [bacterium]